MGHSIVLFLDATKLDTVTDAELASTLAEAVGVDTYPTGGVAEGWVGPWQCAGAWHSSLEVELTVSAQGFVDDVAGDGVFSPTHSAGEAARATREYLRRPSRTPSDDAAALLFGPDPLDAPGNPSSAGSVWWVYAGGIDGLAVADLEELGAKIRAAHHARLDASIDVGSWMHMINCAGRVGPEGHVRLRLAGNLLSVEVADV